MIPYAQALNLVCEQAGQIPRRSEFCPIESSVGRILAQDLVCREPLPLFDNSAMDGFAVTSAETCLATEDAPLRFPVWGCLLAGDLANAAPPVAGACAIMTGAPFPPDHDACVRLEDVRVLQESGRQWIELRTPVAPRAHRRIRGEDLSPGNPLLKAGQRLQAEDLLCLAAQGFTQVLVTARLRAGVISTGAELCDYRQTPGPGQVRDVNTPYLIAGLRARGLEAVDLGTCGDDPAAFVDLLARAGDFDVVVTTGAVSKGVRDFVSETLTQVRARVIFCGVQIRPAKPLTFAQLDTGNALFALPGNPTAVALGLRFFIDPWVRARQGQAPETPRLLPLDQPVFTRPTQTTFLRGTLVADESLVRPHVEQRASMLHPFLGSNVWLKVQGNDAPETVARAWTYPFTPPI